MRLSQIKIKLFKTIALFFIVITTGAAAPVNSFLLPGFLNSPAIKMECDQVIVKEKFSICYSFDNQIPLLTFYKLTSDDVISPVQPREYLRTSKDIPKAYRPSLGVYRGSYWDAGHLPAAASLDINPEAADDVFMVSWCAPQNPNLNRTVWQYIERYERKLALLNGEVYIITGVVPNSSNLMIKARINIPLYYFKIIFIPSKKIMLAYKAANVAEEHRPGNEINNYQVDPFELINDTGLILINFE